MQNNAKVNILRIARVDNDPPDGGWTEVENVLHNNLPCRIVWAKGIEKIQFKKDTYYKDAKLFCRVVDITTDDRVVYNSKKYEIVDVNNPDNRNKRLVLDLKLIE